MSMTTKETAAKTKTTAMPYDAGGGQHVWPAARLGGWVADGDDVDDDSGDMMTTLAGG